MIHDREYICTCSLLDGIDFNPAHELIRCKDCKYYGEDGDCWHELDNDGRKYYQSVINEPNPDDYCSRAERKDNGRVSDRLHTSESMQKASKID